VEKLNSQKAMIGWLLSKSGELLAKAEDIGKIQKSCDTLKEEVNFVKNFIAQTMNDQNTLIKEMISETRRVNKAENLTWMNSNILQYDCSKSLNLLVDNVPRCFDETKKLIITHNNGLRKKIKTLKDQLIRLDKSQGDRWGNFTNSLIQHFRDEITNASQNCMINYYKSQEDNLENLNRKCRKTWKTLDFIKNILLEQMPQGSEAQIRQNKIGRKINAVTRYLIKNTLVMDQGYQNEITVVSANLEIVLIKITSEFNSDPQNDDFLNKEARILEAIEFYYQRFNEILLNGQVEGATAGLTEVLVAGFDELINFILQVNMVMMSK
jgi:hypothetical protein